MHRYFFLLVSHHIDSSQLRNIAQTGRKGFRHFLKLSWRPLGTFQGYK